MSDQSLNEIYRCTPRQAREFIIDCIGAHLVPFVQSSPGLGKSTIIKSVSDDFRLKVIDHRLSTSAPEDLTGLPDFLDTPTGRQASFTPFDIFPLASWDVPEGYDGWNVFLDEANSATKLVQAASYKLVLDKMVGQKLLHPNVVITMAGNLSTDRALVTMLSTAMQSRLIHIEMIADLVEWMEDVALPQGYDERIIAFINYKGVEALMDFRPEHQEKTFACPRTWEFMNALIKGKTFRTLDGGDYEMERKTPLYAGTITSGLAVEFVQFTKIFENMVQIADVIRDPLNTPVPQDTSAKWAVVSHLATKVDEKSFDKVAQYANRLDLSFKVLFFRATMVRHPNLRQHPAFAKAMIELSRYLHGV